MKSAATDLETFLQSTLGTQARRGARVLSGPTIALDVRATAVLKPVLQEIASDIATHGCPDRGGDVAVRWSCDDQGRCVIELSNGNIASAKRADGREAPAGAAPTAFDRPGDGMISCETSEQGARIIVPARYVSDWKQPDPRSVPPAVAPADPLEGRSVLVVEDQLIIALDLEMLLKERGAVAVQLSGSVNDALKSIEAGRPDIAILDVNLGSTTSFPVACELQRLGIP
ncbi:MAG TPA: hypothetical protein VF226_14125, partial [Hyphomicrobiaceae bacterium]